MNDGISVTQDDMAAAREALVQGTLSCPLLNYGRHECDCDVGEIASCKTRIARVALAIAKARTLRIIKLERPPIQFDPD